MGRDYVTPRSRRVRITSASLAAIGPDVPQCDQRAGYPQTTAVMNPFSELIINLYGTDIGSHARTAIGAAAVPLNLLVVISAEVEISAHHADVLWAGQLRWHAQGMLMLRFAEPIPRP
jgi:hypothetical protein